MLTTLALLLMIHCPMHAKHTASSASADPKHGAQVDARHDTFGMHHGESRHQFRLYADGGAIELRGSAPEVIRKHLREIAEDFSKADFDTPRFVHGKVPDGVEEMKRLHPKITYRYEEVPEGGRIRIRTKDPQALAAVHAFLRFQVIEHRTGQTGAIEPE